MPIIKNVIPATFENWATGFSTGPPLEVDTDSPDFIKDTFVLCIHNVEENTARELGSDPTLYTLRPMAFGAQDTREIALACLTFLAGNGDIVAKAMLEFVPRFK